MVRRKMKVVRDESGAMVRLLLSTWSKILEKADRSTQHSKSFNDHSTLRCNYKPKDTKSQALFMPEHEECDSYTRREYDPSSTIPP